MVFKAAAVFSTVAAASCRLGVRVGKGEGEGEGEGKGKSKG